MKKLLSIILALLMITTAFTPAMNAFAADNCDYLIFYVEGMGSYIYIKDENGKEKRLYPTLSLSMTEEDKNNILEQAKSCAALLPTAMLTGDYTEYTNAILKALEPYYADLCFDENGNNYNGSYCPGASAPGGNKGISRLGEFNNSSLRAYGYDFNYDWRISPFEAADYLDAYIEKVIATYHKDRDVQIILSGRCYGSAVVSAYLANLDGKYNTDRVRTVNYYMGTMNGVTSLSNIFANKFEIDGEALSDFLETGDLVKDLDGEIIDFIRASLEGLNAINGVNPTTGVATEVIKEIYKNIAPDVIMATYGTFPAIWSFIKAKDYKAAKKYVFAGQSEKYKGLIEKIDKYHYGVQTNLEQLLYDFENSREDRNVYVIAKYGFSGMPIVENAKEQSDALVLLKEQSFGATAAYFDKKLSTKHISAMEDKKYLSSDHIVDASTGLFPDKTWFIKNCNHNNTSMDINRLMAAIFFNDIKYGKTTVDSLEQYPQFLYYEIPDYVPGVPEDQYKLYGKLLPLTDEPAPDSDKRIDSAYTLLKWLTSFFKILTVLFEKLKGL